MIYLKIQDEYYGLDKEYLLKTFPKDEPVIVFDDDPIETEIDNCTLEDIFNT
jgi:hypothetical protein